MTMAKKWVYGTRTKKWYLVDVTDRDYAHGITQDKMKKIGKEKAINVYLRS